jgi:hypothetical protein
MFEGAKYSFASLVFRKHRELPDDEHYELTIKKEKLEREFVALSQEKLQWSADRSDTITMRNSRLMRLLWKIRKKRSNA